MRILITGISGQDGRLLSELLCQYGYEITGTTRAVDKEHILQIRSLLPESINLISLDIESYSAWIGLLESIQFDVIYHLSAQSSVGASFTDPLSNILNPAQICYYLLDAVRLHQPNVKVIFAGTTEVFGSHGTSLIDEYSLKRPMSPYAVGKLSQESVIAFFRNSYGIWVSNAYLSNHESLYRGNQFVTMKIVKGAFDILHGKTSSLTLGNLSVIRDWGWAPEYMEALFLLSKLNDPVDFIIATGLSISLFDFASEVFKYFGLSFDCYVHHDSSLLRVADSSEVYYDVSKVRAMLNWEAAIKGADVPRKLAHSYHIKATTDE